jgi:hypothetical protein
MLAVATRQEEFIGIDGKTVDTPVAFNGINNDVLLILTLQFP